MLDEDVVINIIEVTMSMNPFVNLNCYPLYEVTLNKTNSGIPGPLTIYEYVRAAGIGNANDEARRLHPGYSPTARVHKVDNGRK